MTKLLLIFSLLLAVSAFGEDPLRGVVVIPDGMRLDSALVSGYLEVGTNFVYRERLSGYFKYTLFSVDTVDNIPPNAPFITLDGD